MGYAGHVGIHNLQITLEKKVLDWTTDFIRGDADPYRARTAIGDMGTLKLSDRILFRVKPEFRYEQPILLREASYNVYKSSLCFASRPNFKTVQPETDRTTWELQTGSGAHRITTVSPSQRGQGHVKTPQWPP
jgi:hypothetical protein